MHEVLSSKKNIYSDEYCANLPDEINIE